MSALDYLFIAAAVWYWVYALTRSHGPFGIFAGIREHAPLGGLTTCLFCSSLWLALLMWVLWPTVVQPFVIVSGLAGIAVMLGNYTGSSQQTG